MAIVPATADADVRADALADRRSHVYVERAMDEVLADSFPASDPPSWNPGIARVDPAGRLVSDARPGDVVANTRPPGVVGSGFGRPPRPASAEPTFLQGVASLTGAAGIVLVVPFVILLVGLPVALSVRGLVEALGWLLALVLR